MQGRSSDLKPASSGNEALFRRAKHAIPTKISVGDRFINQGRRVTEWRIDGVTHLPRVGQIVTLAEIDGTARLQIHAPDISSMGFYRVEDQKV
jgi:hypothetical protein